MREMLRFLLAVAAALVLMLAVRALAVTVCTVPGNALAPTYVSGDRIVVNRWSYGLRVGGKVHVPYGRILRQPLRRGDIVAFESPVDSLGGLYVCRCRAVPGDTLRLKGNTVLVPGRVNCARADYYWLESISSHSRVDSRQLGLIPEQCIVGRVVGVLFSHDDTQPFYQGYRKDRFCR